MISVGLGFLSGVRGCRARFGVFVFRVVGVGSFGRFRIFFEEGEVGLWCCGFLWVK